ncbi:MAG: ferredoxin [Solirubrobacteraceae bacterium]|nr:ferredoxin [Actinomycetota bacterium]MEA2131866.1 ferredoxin [Solirubrobacteraceae bacterium]
MRVTVDYDLCESNGICSGLLPAVFDLRDDDLLYLLDESPSEDKRAQVELAVRRCPRQAISLEG